MENNIIIIGGNGFVGKATINFFSKNTNFNIFILDKIKQKISNNISYFYCDIEQPEFYSDIIHKLPKNSYVVNLAAKHYANYPPKKNRFEWFLQTNYEGEKMF